MKTVKIEQGEIRLWRIILLTAALLGGCYAVNGQSISPKVISPAGDYFVNGNNALSWTLGEVAVETYNNTNNNLTQGFHQPYYVITEVEEKNSVLEINIKVFPNPAKEIINISINGIKESSSVIIEMFDASGKLVGQEQKNISASNLLTINMKMMPVATYLLKISSIENNIFKSYKIQKML